MSPNVTQEVAASADPETFVPFIFWREVMSQTTLTMRERAWEATDEDTSTLRGGGKRPISAIQVTSRVMSEGGNSG